MSDLRRAYSCRPKGKTITPPSLIFHLVSKEPKLGLRFSFLHSFRIDHLTKARTPPQSLTLSSVIVCSPTR